MKVAVCGGTGFLGRALVRQLLAQGHEVWVLARRPEQVAKLFPSEVSAIQFEAYGSLDPKVLRGVEAVYQLSGESIAQRWTPEAKKRIRDSRELATRTLARASVEAGVETFLVASAVGYYGAGLGEIFSESSPGGSGFAALLCRRNEEAAAPAAEAGVRVVALRTGPVLHTEGGLLPKILPLFRLGLGGKVGTGKQWLSWIHRDDAVGLMLHALQKNLRGPLNVVAPEPVTNAEFTRALGKTLHRPTLLPVPETAVRLGLGEAASMALEGQRVSAQHAVETGYVYRFPTLKEALADLLP